jgi:hypothetical protein
MAGGIVYLDVDDEITSAAARIRDVPGRRAALVLPYGSRVATSRINFRLLSRDALINEKQLAVVAGDSATRALAASAGLPVFASVAEYESSLVEDRDAAPPASTPPAAAQAAAPPATPSAGPPASATAAISEPPEPPSSPPADETEPGDFAGEDTAPFQMTGAQPSRRERQRSEPWPPSPRPSVASRTRPGTGPRSRLPIVIVLAALGLVLLVGGVGAYVMLPSATIVVTPRTESLVPLRIVVTADPDATEPDAADRVVPAVVLPLEVTVSDTFPATGERVEETPATGTVRFSNLDFLRTNSVPAGSIVSTNAGIRFRTAKAVTVPKADLVGLTVFPGQVNVNVTAVDPGTAGNVQPNTIVIVPKGEDPQALKVVNPDETSGGTHEAFPQVAQEDVDAAMEQLTTALDAEFQARLADPSIAPPDTTVFVETATLGEATPSQDPAGLVEQEVESFELGLTATGSVVTVNPAPVAAIADELLRAGLEPGYRLVADSIQVQVGEPVVSGQSISFSATATGQQVAVLDADELRTMVLGKPLDDARQLLSAYGDVELTAWPDWVGTVPTIADRVELRIEDAVPVETPAPSGPAS